MPAPSGLQQANQCENRRRMAKLRMSICYGEHMLANKELQHVTQVTHTVGPSRTQL